MQAYTRSIPLWVLLLVSFTTLSQPKAFHVKDHLSRVTVPGFVKGGGSSNKLATLECWVRFSNLTGPTTFSPILGDAEGTADFSWLVYKAPTNQIIAIFFTTGGMFSVMSGTAVQKDRWYHIAFTTDNSKIRLYIDGGLEAQRNYSGFPIHSNNQFIIGDDIRQSSAECHIDEVRFWKRTLSQIEIQNRMREVLKPTSEPYWADLQLYFSFDNYSGGSSFNGLSSAGRTGNISGGGAADISLSPFLIGEQTLSSYGIEKYMFTENNLARVASINWRNSNGEVLNLLNHDRSAILKFGQAPDTSFISLSVAHDNYEPIEISDSLEVRIEKNENYYGPGGIGSVLGNSDLKSWISADSVLTTSDSIVTTCLDRAGNNFSSSAVGALVQRDNSKGFKTLNFDGSSFLQISGYQLFENPYQSISVFTVFSENSATSSGNIITHKGSACGTQTSLGYGIGTTDGKDFGISNACNEASGSSSAPGFSSLSLMSFGLNASDSLLSHYTLKKNGSTLSVAEENGGWNHPGAYPDHSADLLIGAGWNGSSEVKYHQGDLAELIIYKRQLSSLENNLVEEYLAEKYQLVKSADRFQADKAGFYHDLTGIGAESDHVKRNALVKGLRLENDDATINNGAYLIAAHDNGAAFSSSENLGSASAASERIERVWHIHKTGSIGSALVFNFSEMPGVPFDPAKNYHLLYAPDSNFNFSEIGSPDVVGENEIYFDLSNAELHSGYYTLGVEGSFGSPLNISINSFDAVAEKGSAVIHWDVALETSGQISLEKKSGKNTDIHAIADGLEVNGRFIDQNVEDSEVFYRIKVRTEDGLEVSSGWKRVHFNDHVRIRVFPNPATDVVHITLPTESTQAEYALLNEKGQLIKSQILTEGITGIPFSQYPSGSYTLQIIREDQVFSKKIIKQ